MIAVSSQVFRQFLLQNLEHCISKSRSQQYWVLGHIFIKLICNSIAGEAFQNKGANRDLLLQNIVVGPIIHGFVCAISRARYFLTIASFLQQQSIARATWRSNPRGRPPLWFFRNFYCLAAPLGRSLQTTTESPAGDAEELLDDDVIVLTVFSTRRCRGQVNIS
jgi:hypothetical protein